jgi:FkbM family methyltransferase
MSSGMSDAFVLDIGANLGAFSIPVARRVAAHGAHVYAFEAQRIIFQQLCGNVFLNRVGNCFAYNVAVGASDGMMRLPKIDYLRSENIGSVSLLPEIQDVTRVSYSRTEFEEVELKALDSFRFKGRCSFIKIDVEGFESEVLKGALRLIETNDFPPVLFEEWRKGKFTGAAGKSVERRQEETRSLLSGLGYNFLHLGTDILAQHPKSLAQVHVEMSSDQRGKLVRVR